MIMIMSDGEGGGGGSVEGCIDVRSRHGLMDVGLWLMYCFWRP